jgi:exonuclease VII small subunit
MADQLHGIVTQLEQQKAAIERALAALPNIDGGAEERR